MTAELRADLARLCQEITEWFASRYTSTKSERYPLDLNDLRPGGVTHGAVEAVQRHFPGNLLPDGPTGNNPWLSWNLACEARDLDKSTETAVHMVDLRTWAEAVLENEQSQADSANTQANTIANSGEKNLRLFNHEAAACAKEYRRRKQSSKDVHLKDVVRDYVHENGGSVDGIYQRLMDHPDKWKVEVER